MSHSYDIENHLLAFVWLIKLSRKLWGVNVHFPFTGNFPHPALMGAESLWSNTVVFHPAGIGITWWPS